MEPVGSIEPAQPFASRPAPAGPGKGRALLIGCGALLLLLGVAALVFVWKAPDVFRWTMEKFEDQVMAALPPSVGDDERSRLREAFAGAREAVLSGQADPADLQALQKELGRLTTGGLESLTPEDVERLTAALEKVAAGAGRDAREPDVPISAHLAVHAAG